jgi:hypothetical protein
MNLTGLNEFLERNRLNSVSKENVHYFKLMNRGYYTIITDETIMDLEEFQGEFFDSNPEEFIHIH